MPDSLLIPVAKADIGRRLDQLLLVLVVLAIAVAWLAVGLRSALSEGIARASTVESMASRVTARVRTARAAQARSPGERVTTITLLYVQFSFGVTMHSTQRRRR